MEKNPRTLQELEERFMTEGVGPRLPGTSPLGAGLRVPRVRWHRGVGHLARALDVHGLWAPGVGDGGHDLRGHAYPADALVPGDLVGGQPENGASALGLQRVLGLGSYRTAWTWLHKLRRAMVRPGRDRVSVEVEVDETIVGGVEPGGGRRHLGKKALVVIAAEVRGRGIGRIRMQRVADASAESLLAFVPRSVEPGAVVITDGLQSYRGLSKRGYRHDRRGALGSGESTDAVLPRIHRVAALLKRRLLGTHQGGVSREHLDYYLDEFTFRFNRRTSRHRGKLFYRLLEQAVAVGPVPYAAMVKGIRGLKKKHHHNGYGCWSQGYTWKWPRSQITDLPHGSSLLNSASRRLVTPSISIAYKSLSLPCLLASIRTPADPSDTGVGTAFASSITRLSGRTPGPGPGAART